MKIRGYEVPRTLVIVSAVTCVALAYGAARIAFAPADSAGPAKKAALEAAKISAKHLPVAAQCYDQVFAAQPNRPPLATASTCKCLVSEVAKYAPSVQTNLSNLVMIGLKASANTSSAPERSSYIQEAVLNDEGLSNLDVDQAKVMQTGIKHVMKSCPMPEDQVEASLSTD